MSSNFLGNFTCVGYNNLSRLRRTGNGLRETGGIFSHHAMARLWGDGDIDTLGWQHLAIFIRQRFQLPSWMGQPDGQHRPLVSALQPTPQFPVGALALHSSLQFAPASAY